MDELRNIDTLSAIREVIRYWRPLTDLANFAARRHGFGSTNGGFGVTYPRDLDPCEKHIAEGFVEIYGYWGAPEGYEHVVPERIYLAVLAQELSEAGHPSLAEHVRFLASNAPNISLKRTNQSLRD